MGVAAIKYPLNIVLLVAVVDLIGFGLILPLQAVYAERMEASGFVFGLLLGCRAAAALIFSPLLGKLSDHVGRRPVLTVAIAGSAIAHIILGIGDLTNSLTLLFVARIADGITGANIATAQACIADVTDSEERAKGMGLFGAAMGVGFVLGPAIGGTLAFIGTHFYPQTGTSWPAFGAAGIAVTALIIVWTKMPETRTQAASSKTGGGLALFAGLRAASQVPSMMTVLVIVFWGTLAIVLWEVGISYLTTRHLGWNEVGLSLLFVYFGIMMIVVQGGLVGPLSRRFGEPHLVTAGPFLTAIGLIMFALVPAIYGGVDHADVKPNWPVWILYFVGCIPVALGGGISSPALNSMLSRLVRSDVQGITMGVSNGLQSFTRAIGPPIAGLLYDVSPHWPFSCGAIAMIAIGGFAILVIARVKRDMDRTEASTSRKSPSP